MKTHTSLGVSLKIIKNLIFATFIVSNISKTKEKPQKYKFSAVHSLSIVLYYQFNKQALKRFINVTSYKDKYLAQQQTIQ